jgi:hypothetical protein
VKRIKTSARDSKDSVGGLGRARILLTLGGTRWRSGDLVGAREAFVEADALARKHKSPEIVANAALGFAAGLGGFFGGPYGDRRIIDVLESALVAMPARERSLRARLLARLATELQFTNETRAKKLAREARALAERFGDASVLLAALYAECWVSSGAVPARRLAAADRMLRIAARSQEREMVAWARQFRLWALIELGDVAGCDEEAGKLELLVQELSLPLLRARLSSHRAMRALLDGRLADAEKIALELAEAAPESHRLVFAVTSMSQRLVVQWLRGEWEQTKALLDTIADKLDTAEGQLPMPQGRPFLTFLFAAMQYDTDARIELEQVAQRGLIDSREHAWLITRLFVLGFGCSRLKDTRRASILYEALRPHAGRNVIVPGGAALAFGSTSLVLGCLAVVLGRLDAAVGHLEAAVEENQRFANRPFLAISLCELAAALSMRDALADRERAQEVHHRAARMITRRELGGLRPRLSEIEKALAGDACAAMPAFHRQGNEWILTYQERSIRLKDAKGLHDLAVLLAYPGRDVHALDLITGWRDPGEQAPKGDAAAGLSADPILDLRARADYRARIEELRAEIDEARRCNDTARIESAREEIEQITRALVRVFGRGGRPRGFTSPAERARQTVTWRIRRSISTIRREHSLLGQHLDRFVRTGVFCSYAVPPASIAWDVRFNSPASNVTVHR